MNGCYTPWSGQAYNGSAFPPYPGGCGGGAYPPNARAMMATKQYPQGPVTPEMVATMIQAANPCATGPLKRTGTRNGGVGFFLNPLPVGGPTDVTVTINKPFAGHFLVIPSDFAPNTQLNDIKIGGVTQLINGPFPGRAFSEAVQCCTDLDLDAAAVGQQIILQVTNLLGAPIANWSAMLQGDRLDC